MSIAYNDGLPWCFGLMFQDLVEDLFKPSLCFTMNPVVTRWRL